MLVESRLVELRYQAECEVLDGITPDGQTFPIAFNRLSDDELAGACFSPDGRTLFVNIQSPGCTFAIWARGAMPSRLGATAVLPEPTGDYGSVVTTARAEADRRLRIVVTTARAKPSWP